MTWAQDPRVLRLLEKKAKRGEYVQALAEKPELFDDLEFPWRAFSDLHCSRPSGFGPSGLRVTDIVAWLDLHCILDPESRQTVYNHILILDAYWLKWANEQAGKKKKVKSNGAQKAN